MIEGLEHENYLKHTPGMRGISEGVMLSGMHIGLHLWAIRLSDSPMRACKLRRDSSSADAAESQPGKGLEHKAHTHRGDCVGAWIIGGAGIVGFFDTRDRNVQTPKSPCAGE